MSRARVGSVSGCLPKRWLVCSPLDLSSFVHSLSNSTTSSGSTLVRTQASDHCGFLLTLGAGATLFFAVASLPLKTREKKGMMDKDRGCEEWAMLAVDFRSVAFYSSPSTGGGEFGERGVWPEASWTQCAWF